MDDEWPPYGDEQSRACPFLHRDEGTSSHVCLWKTSDPIVISPGYVDVYCRVSKHRECSLFLRAERSAQPDEHDGQVAQASKSRAPDDRPVLAVGPPGDDDLPRERVHESVELDGDCAPLLEIETVRRNHVAAPPVPTITDPKTGTSLTTSSVTISGTAGNQFTVKLYDWGSFVAETDANLAGRWSVTLSPLEDGDHAYYAVAIDTEGQASAQSAVVTVSSSNAGTGPGLPAASEFGVHLRSKFRGLFGRSRRPIGLQIEREPRAEPAPAAVGGERPSGTEHLKDEYSTAPHGPSAPSLESVEDIRPTPSTRGAGVGELPTFDVSPMMSSAEESTQHPILLLTRLRGDRQYRDTRTDKGFIEGVGLPEATSGPPVIPADRMVDGPLKYTSGRVETPLKPVDLENEQPTEVMTTPATPRMDTPLLSVVVTPLRGDGQCADTRTDQGFIEGVALPEATRGLPAMPAEVMPMSATSCVDMPSSSVVVTPTPPSVATPIEADAYTVPIDEAVAILSLEVGAVLPGKQEKFPGVEMDEMDLKTHLTDYVTSTETVDRQPPQPAVGMQEDIASATPSAEPPDSTAPPFRSPVEATFHHAIPALHTAPMVTPRPPRQGRRRYLLPSAAAVVIALLAGAWLLLRHSASQPAAHPVPVHSTSVIPEPATTWSFPPLQAGVDQLIFTFSNPGNAAVQVRITAPGAGNEVVWSARVSPQSGAETALDPHVYNGTLAVQASGPVVAERTTVHHGTVQYTYGIPAGRSGRP